MKAGSDRTSRYTQDLPRKRHKGVGGGKKEDAESSWVAGEDEFALDQMKRGALIRVKEGRADAADSLVANLRIIEEDKEVYDEDIYEGMELAIPAPLDVIKDLSFDQLGALMVKVMKFVALDTRPPNQEFWSMILLLCQEQQLDRLNGSDPEARVVEAVASDIDAVLADKSYDELVSLESRIQTMLKSDDTIDVDFWTRLLKELTIRKAQSKIMEIHNQILDKRVEQLRRIQKREALRARLQIQNILDKGTRKAVEQLDYEPEMDEVPSEEQSESQTVQTLTIDEFNKRLVEDRKIVKKMKFLPLNTPKDREISVVSAFEDDGSQDETIRTKTKAETTMHLYEKEVSRPLAASEEAFNTEDPSFETKKNPGQLIKPRYSNRALTGYDWNRFNQTHYDSNTPPPKVVQGYKFNIFYPELAESKSIPTFKLIRDRKNKGQPVPAAAGQDQTCIICFQAPAPYQDIAFRIVDRQWDSSSHRNAQFKSKFENGVLQLHFRFRKVFYRD